MIGPGVAANDLRAQARYWDRRLPKKARLLFHMQRSAQLIESVLETGPRKAMVKRLRRAAFWMSTHSSKVDHWEFVYGATQLSTSLYRAHLCLLDLAKEAENANS